ncbi:MAG: hypothetical protein DHS20C12_21680 [Pseudohongiella sp.]|nr:MAG: hypothetical protein DHS20C12_21680 [Pseudohongiella sp.]
MKNHKTITSMALLALMAFSGSSFAGPPATIADIAWMTGNWAGALGPNQLEENWIMGEGGSIAAMVRMTGEGSTSMFEMITIEEVEGSLVLHIQQWDPGMVSRTEGPQEMELVEVTENSVKFKATSEGGMSGLGYSHPDADTFMIHVENPGRPVFDITLKARSIWK